MVKIPCQVRRQLSNVKMPFVTFSASSKSPPIHCGGIALVDTGSPYTGLSPREALKSRLRINTTKGQIIRLAGLKFYAPVLKGATIRFRTVDGQIISYDLPDMRIFIPTKTDENSLREAQYIPTIVGSDLLEQEGLSLFFNPKDEIAYLISNE